jgi:nitrite reductase (NO-forming)
MIRVREGDTVEMRLTNPTSAHEHENMGSHFPHSIDLHAVTGPGGGAKVTQIAPDGKATFRFKALNPGVYVYHCATPVIPMHVANGMYGLIVVEPVGGFTKVDREYYVMEGDFYTKGKNGEQGFQDFSLEKMMAEDPEYIVFNGSANSLVGKNALQANVGETVRIYFGVGGPNVVSSFHVIGEIFDRAYLEGSTSAIGKNVQTTLVPAGGAAIVEFKVEVPGTYLLVDHSLSRIMRGAVGMLQVSGAENSEIFKSLENSSGQSGGGH